MSIFEKYTSNIDAEELKASQEEIQASARDRSDYDDVPTGIYEVKVEKLECKVSSKGNPMVSIWFRILKGDYENHVIFYNGVFHEDWMRHRVVKMLSDLMDDHDHEAEINLILKSGSVAEINNFCLDVHEDIDGKMEYLLDYSEKKGYKNYEIKEVYDV